MESNQPKHLSPWIAWSLVIGAFGVALFCTWYYYFQVGVAYDNAFTNTLHLSKKSSSTTSSTASATADWKTYTNTKYGYTFKYPQDWKVSTSTPESYMTEPWKSYLEYTTYTQPNGQDMNGYVSVSNKSVDELKKLIKSTISGEKTVTFADTNATKIDLSYNNTDSNYSSTGYNYYIVKNGVTYTITGITLSSNENEKEKSNNQIVNQILSTFQFTK